MRHPGRRGEGRLEQPPVGTRSEGGRRAKRRPRMQLQYRACRAPHCSASHAPREVFAHRPYRRRSVITFRLKLDAGDAASPPLLSLGTNRTKHSARMGREERFAAAPWAWRLRANAWTQPALAVQQSGRGIADDFAITSAPD